MAASRWIAPTLALTAALTSRARAASAQSVLAQGELFGHAVRVERTTAGRIDLLVAGRPTVALAAADRAATASVERVAQGAGAVLVVRTTGASPAAAVVAGAPGRVPDVLFAGATGPVGEDLGERHTTEILVRDFDGRPGSEVVIGERHEDVALCGVGSALVDTRVVDPATLAWVHFGLNPLRADAVGAALPAAAPINAVVVAPGAPAPALAALSFGTRVASGQVATPASSLTDSSATTAWTPRRFDFVTSPVTLAGIEAERVLLTAPPAPDVLPHELTLLLRAGGQSQRLDVTLPAGPIAAGARVAVPLVPHRTLSCLSIVVTEAPATGHAAIAEVALATALDANASPAAELVRRLDGANGDEAALLVARMGDAGVTAVADALPTLSEPGARRAIALLATLRTTASARAIVAALARPELEDAARVALEQMGPATLDALGAAVATDARAARLIHMAHAPLEARLHAMAHALDAEPLVWHRVRPEAVALVREAGALEGWLALVSGDDSEAASRALAVAADASQADPAARATVAARARAVHSDDFEDRFRLLAPLAGDAEGRTQVARVALEDADADLRLEAVRALERTGDDAATLTRAAHDRVPRVRALAASGLRGRPDARALLVGLLRSDPWPTVQRSAAEALAGDAASAPVLLEALNGASVVTVRAVLEALSRTPSSAIGPRLMAYAEDGRNNPEMRAEALDAIYARCDAGLSDRLYALFNHENDAMLPPSEQMVGQRALLTLAHVDPARLRRELPSMQTNAFGTTVIQRALRDACPAR